MILWITYYIIAGLLFLLLVEFFNRIASIYNILDNSMDNTDRWILSLLWPLGVVVMIKSLIDYFVNRE